MVYYVNLDEDMGICFRGDPNDIEQTPEGRVIMRIVTSWATTPEDTDRLIACL